MKKIILFFAFLFVLVSCQQDELLPEPVGECVLEFASVRTSRAASSGIDPDLAVKLLKDGAEVAYYAPGTVPQKLTLEPGIYTVQAYTLNADTWQTANGGLGEPYYHGETTVQLEDDFVSRVNMSVPMINYAVGLQLPEMFSEVFSEYTLTLIVGNRALNLYEGERAYFDVGSGSFIYTFTVVNTDGNMNSATPVVYSDVQAGKLYQLSYSYDYGLQPEAQAF